jgi:uncharacterized protein involved in response to NO
VGLGGIPATIAGMADLCFIPALTIALAIPLFLEKSKRNYLLLALLPALWICDAHLHLRSSGLLPQSYIRTDLVAVNLVVVILVIITGRIVPLFTRNALGDESIRMNAGINTAAIVGVLLVAVVELFTSSGPVMAVAAGAAGLLVISRSVHWGILKTLQQPILWILHVGHAWIGAGLLLKAASAVSLRVPPSVATHALTAGAIGTLTLGMMARVTMGHTGRQIRASHLMTAGFVAITVSALLRVLGPWLRIDLTKPVLISSGIFWSLAFAIYLAVNVRALLGSRADGKPG